MTNGAGETFFFLLLLPFAFSSLFCSPGTVCLFLYLLLSRWGICITTNWTPIKPCFAIISSKFFFFCRCWYAVHFVILISLWTVVFISIVNILRGNRFRNYPFLKYRLVVLCLSISFVLHSFLVFLLVWFISWLPESIQLLWIDQFNLVCIKIVAIKFNQVTTI